MQSAVKIAFVTPWYGQNIPGGAEAEARRTAQHLLAAGYDVEVLTTCVKDFFSDWAKNHYRPKTTTENGITVRRFKVGNRDRAAFDAVNLKLMNGVRVSAENEQTYISEMINSPDLYDFIAQNQANYLFIFIPYMFATTYYGVQIAPQRSIVIPCLHDEAYAEMALYRQTLPQTLALVLHTQSERQLADKLFGPSPQSRPVLGEGVDTDLTFEAERFRQKFELHQPFILYAGRREAGKNTPLLLDYWRKAVASGQLPADSQLVLMGAGDAGALPPQTVDLGFVPRQDMLDGMAAAAVFVNPSVNESFSLVLMEAWLAGTPTLVHGDCAVTKEHVVNCNGGLYFDSAEEFGATIEYLLSHSKQAAQMGGFGRKYVLDNYQWPTIIEKYSALFEELL